MNTLDRQLFDHTTRFIDALQNCNIFCLASGQVGSKERLYFFAIAESNATFLVETTLLHNDKSVTLQVKASESSSEEVQAFLVLFKRSVSQFFP